MVEKNIIKINSLIIIYFIKLIDCYGFLSDFVKRASVWFYNEKYLQSQKFNTNENSLQSRRILIIRKGYIGDLLTILSLIRALRLKYPDIEVNFMTMRRFFPLFESTIKTSNLIEFPLSKKNGFFKFLLFLIKLKKKKYDCVISFSPDIKTALFASIIGRKWLGFTEYKLKQKVFSGKTGKLFEWVWRKDSTCFLVRYLEMMNAIGFVIPPNEIRGFFFIDQPKIKKTLSRYGIKKDDAFIVIHPGGGEHGLFQPDPRRWPLEYYNILISALLLKYRAKIVLIGSKCEETIGNLLENINSHEIINGIGTTTISELGHLIFASRVLIGNESGPSQIAWALKKPSISVAGPQPYELSAQTSEINRILSRRPYCAPCLIPGKKIQCNEFECMKKLTPDCVIKYIEKMVEKKYIVLDEIK